MARAARRRAGRDLLLLQRGGRGDLPRGAHGTSVIDWSLLAGNGRGGFRSKLLANQVEPTSAGSGRPPTCTAIQPAGGITKEPAYTSGMSDGRMFLVSVGNATGEPRTACSAPT